MNILYVTEFFPPERVAGAYRAYFLGKGLSERGHNITVFTTYPNFPSGKRFEGYGEIYNKHEFISERLEVLRFPIIERPNTTIINRLLMYTSFFVSGFFSFLFHISSFKRKKFDVVLGSSGPIFVTWLAWWISSLLHLNLVVEYRDLGYALISNIGMSRSLFVNKLFKKIELAPAWHSNAIVVLTEGFKKLLKEEGFQEEKIFVITNGVKIDVPINNESITTHTGKNITIGYFGTFGASQNLMAFIKAMQLLKEYPVYLILVGDGAKREELKKVINKNKIKKVKMYNSVPHSRLKKFYNMCDLCLVSLKCSKNFSATIPSKIFDIMLHKKPILFVGPEGEASSIILKAKAGICIFSDDPHKIASCVNGIFKNGYQKKFLEMGENGYNFVIRNYNWDILSKKYEEVLYRLNN